MREPALALSALEESQSAPCAVFDGDAIFVAFADNSAGWTDISAVRVQPDGEILDASPLQVSVSPNSQYEPAIASAGIDDLAVWSSDGAQDSKDIYGAVLDGKGAVVASEPTAICTAAGDQTKPAVCSDGTSYLVAWQYTDLHDIYGLRITPQGEFLDQEACLGFTIADEEQARPRVAFDGARFLVSWEDSRDKADDPLGTVKIYGAWAQPDGVFYRDFLISGLEGNVADAWASANACGDTLVLYSGWTALDDFKANRIFGSFQ
ncbi:MAG: hypothetical protein JXR96_12415 [Deltaproteobacteria bacterium]|nr:hypothetical protein [Deltaproteobacteria bacterium]